MEPIKQLILSVDAMSKGKFDTPMPEVKHNDEICQLRDSIEQMQYAVPVHKEEQC
jgi:nitrogen fixation/metabolism regulation signal transduction histidine kinase